MSYRTGRLLTVDRQPPPVELSDCLDLVPYRPGCLNCGQATRFETFGQLPLLRHGGYGAVLDRTFETCDGCRTTRLRSVQETRPPRRT